MRKEIEVGFFTGEDVDRRSIDRIKSCDAALFIVDSLFNVRIKDELDGKSHRFLKMGAISKNVKGLCFFSACTDSYGLIRNSVACFFRGKLVSLADQNGVCERTQAPSFGLKSLEKNGVRYGVLVGDDILDTFALNSLVLTENDVIINLSAAVFDFDREKLVSSLAFLCGVPIISVGKEKKVFAKGNGDTVYCGEESVFSRKMIADRKYKERSIKILRS